MRKLLPILIVLSFLLEACSPGVKILGSWTSPNKPSQGYDDVFVTALTDNVLARQAVETDFEMLLKEDGVNAQNSFAIFPPGFKSSEVNKDKILDKIRELGSDAILTVAVLDQTNETRHVQGTTVYSPVGFRYYGRFWGYYNFYNPVMYDAGYYTTDKIYYLEANLYDAATEVLIWSSQSETTNPTTLEAFSKSFSKTVVNQLIEDGLIVKK